LVNVVWAFLLGGLELAMGAGNPFGRPPYLGGAGVEAIPVERTLRYAIVAGLVSIPITMARYYAPALVALRGLSPIDALKNSFLGALKNVAPFIVYSLVAMLFAILAILPCGLGLLVYIPVVIASVYVGYRDIFFVESGG